jgi:hypothetical protein
MIEVKKEANYRIDWYSFGNKCADERFPSGKKVIEDRKHYFDMLRRFLLDIDALIESANQESKTIVVERLEAVFKKYNVHFVDVDDVKRVNLDEPQVEEPKQ